MNTAILHWKEQGIASIFLEKRSFCTLLVPRSLVKVRRDRHLSEQFQSIKLRLTEMTYSTTVHMASKRALVSRASFLTRSRDSNRIRPDLTFGFTHKVCGNESNLSHLTHLFDFPIKQANDSRHLTCMISSLYKTIRKTLNLRSNLSL